MTVWFTSDTHFRHTKILEHVPSRPGRHIKDHDDILINNWNSVVKKGDVVYHLGDFALCRFKSALEFVNEILERLNGQVHLIRGNHDKDKIIKANFVTVSDIKRVKVDGQRIILCHYAMRVWSQSHFGTWHLYGHSHGNLPGLNRSLDVGVDCWDYYPVSFEQVKDKLKDIEHVPVDHHGR